MRIKTRWVAHVLFAAVFTTSAWSLDLKREMEFQIPSQTLGSALLQFSKQAGVQVLTGGTEISEASSPGINGLYTLDSGLNRLLKDTGFVYKVAGENTVSIVPQATNGLSATGSGGVAMAQTEGSSGTYGSAETTGTSVSSEVERLEEIVVTAQKRLERLIDVPQSVSVLTSDDLAKLSAVQFRDFANTIPGLTFMSFGAGLTQVTLRGVTAGFDSSATVGIYVDEVPYGSSSAFSIGSRLALDVGLFDIDRIEVLHGPQGTLYGASTMGGLLKYVTKQPDTAALSTDFQGGISGTRNGGVSYNIAGAVNMPIVADKLALRMSGFQSHEGGFIDNLEADRNDIDRSNVYGGRVDLLYTPIETLSVRLGAFLQNISRDDEVIADYTRSGSPVDGELDVRRGLAQPFDQRFRLVSGTVTYDIGSATLTSISSYQRMRVESISDRSRTFVGLLALCPPFCRSYSAVGATASNPLDKFTQEMRLAWNRVGAFQWQIGGFYTREKADSREAFILFDPAGEPAPNDLLAGNTPSRYEEYAAFGDVTYYVTSKLDLTAGMRYSKNHQKTQSITSGLLVPPSKPPRRTSEDVVTYLANARYHLSDRATAYLRYATGYRPGGPNNVLNDPLTGEPLGPDDFESDELKSYEIGFKAETAARRLGLDVAAYYTNWNNIQVSAVRNNFGVLVNAPGGAHIRGAELTLTARPADHLSVIGAFAYQDPRLAEANADLQARKDERLPNVPNFTATLNADYTFAGTAFRPSLGGTLRHVSDREVNFDASTSFPQYRLPEYTLVDLRSRWQLGPTSVQIYVSNLFDKRGQIAAQTWRSPLAEVTLVKPRTYGVSFTTHF